MDAKLRPRPCRAQEELSAPRVHVISPQCAHPCPRRAGALSGRPDRGTISMRPSAVVCFPSAVIFQLRHMSHTITIRLTKQLADWLEDTARRAGVSQGQVVRDQLEK